MSAQPTRNAANASIGSFTPRNTAMKSPTQSAMPTALERFMSVLVVAISSACSTGLPVMPISTSGTRARTSSIAARMSASGRSITSKREKSLRGITPTKSSRPLSLARNSSSRGVPTKGGAPGAAAAIASSSRNAAAPSRSASARGMKSAPSPSRSSRRRASATSVPAPASAATSGSASRASARPRRSSVSIAHVASRDCSGAVTREHTRSIDGLARSSRSRRSTARCASPVRRTPSAPWASTTIHAYSRSPNSPRNRLYCWTYGRSSPMSESVFASMRMRFQLQAIASAVTTMAATTTPTGDAEIARASGSNRWRSIVRGPVRGPR